jgi:predicted ester cyclase
MRRAFSILLFGVVALACATESAETVDGLAANKALARAYIERVINNGEWTAWDEFFGESVAFNGRPMSRAEMETMGGTFKSIISGFRMDIEEQIAEGGFVVTRVTVSGNHAGDYMGLKASGKDVSFGGLAMDRIEDGKIVEMWHEMDLWGTLLMASDD